MILKKKTHITASHTQLKVRDGNEMVPILDLMKESSTMPAELVDEWKDSWKNSQLSKVALSLILSFILHIISQILYKEGMKCTQEKARNRPKMKEVVCCHLPPWKLYFFSSPGVRGITKMRESLSNSL